jgi:hypothetical protein
MDNPETLATLSTQDPRRSLKKENDNKRNTTQKTRKMSNTVPTKKLGVNPGAREG